MSPASLSSKIASTGVWPFVVDDSYGFRGFDDYLMDVSQVEAAITSTAYQYGFGAPYSSGWWHVAHRACRGA